MFNAKTIHKIFISSQKKLPPVKRRFLRAVFVFFFLLVTFNEAAPDFKLNYIVITGTSDIYDILHYNRIIKAVIQVESRGNILAYNLNEEATGAFQIRPIRLLDYNQRTGNNYKIEDCYNYEISEKIFLFYAKRIGYPDYESIARKWNGSGKATLDYWGKVKLYL